MKILVYSLFVLPLLLSCGGGEASSNAIPEKQGPSRAVMISALDSLMGHLQKKEYDKAKDYFVLPKGVSSNRVINMLSKLIPKREISKVGIDALANEQYFQFGPITEVYGQDGIKKAKRAEVEVEQCYGINWMNWQTKGSNLEIMATWDENKFTFFRIDNLGKISANWQEKL
mgnify:CR=1 FL=1|tara:strand:- start:2042 stop:2557 length:516 start_codon:yes stop_codon:yes gene_type:complete